MRRQEIHLRRHRKMPQLRRLTTGRRGLPAALADGLFQAHADHFVPVGGKRAAVRLKNNKGIHRHAVAGGEDLRIVNAKITSIQLAANGGEEVRTIRTPDEDLGAPARGVGTEQDHRFAEIVLQQITRVPGELVWRMAHKVVGAAAVPDLVQRLFINIFHPQQRQRL